MRTQQTQSPSDSVSLKKDTEHKPVLLQEVIYWLDIQSDDIFFDGTLGGVGHAQALVNFLGNRGVFIGTDVASEAITRARLKLADVQAKVVLVHDNFKNIKKICDSNGIIVLNKVLLDLGWSSDQIADESRGFSFSKDEPLDMRLSDIEEANTLTAMEIVNNWDEENIADILYGWGGERYSRRIAKAIVNVRNTTEIKTTLQLADIIKKAVPVSYRYGRINSATRTFQALRIAVNDEIRVLRSALENIKELLAPDARVAIITFHSVEDRVIKQMFKSWEIDGIGKSLTKKPITASDEELKENKRARSAKLRIFYKYARNH